MVTSKMFNEEDFSKDESLICLSQFDFSNLLYNTLFSDFAIIVPNPPNGKKSLIPSHKFILHSSSGYFRNFFESAPNEKEVSVCFPDWATYGIYEILEHIYSRKSIKLSVDNIASIVCVAFSWSVDGLKDELYNFLNSKIPVSLSLPILLKIYNYIPINCKSEQILVEMTGRGLTSFGKAQFENLPYRLLFKIVDYVGSLLPDEKNTFMLCEIIENYFQKNIVNLGSHEYNQLVKKFTMKANHSGIINLYKIGLMYGWNVRLVETKILHTWKNLNQEMLSQLPIQSLKKLLHENFLNIDSEDDLVDFIFLVYKTHSFDIDSKLKNAISSSSTQPNMKSFSVSNFKSSFSTEFTQNSTSHSFFNLTLNTLLDSSSLLVNDNSSQSSNYKNVASDLYSSSNEEDTNQHENEENNNKNISNENVDEISTLWKELRISFLSKKSIERLNQSPLVPDYIKNSIVHKTYNIQQAPRLPRTKVKCLILGACDDSALRDVRNLLLSTSFEESNIQSVRADREFDINMIFEYHSVLIYGFFLFWNRDEVSKKLFEFHNEGGGVFICYGAIRSDSFGIGEPFLSCLPIYHIDNPDLTNEFVITDKRKTRSEGCKYMRIICRARNDGIVENYWDDGVPFLIRKCRDKEGHGAIYVLNATPVSGDIIGQQWSNEDKHIQNMMSNVIIYVSNVLISKRKKENS